MKHIDLFSGIGGFALAVDVVFGSGGYEEVEHLFCDNDSFAQQVIKKHWPKSKIYGDIKSLASDSDQQRHVHRKPQEQPAEGNDQTFSEPVTGFDSPFILTGGFPCQPFSQAGPRKGTEDDRHLWPEMLRVIRDFKPKWVIAENVRGILTIDNGMVFEQVCLDLEASGYEVQPFVIPAVALDAPHRRDRVWFVAHSNGGERKRAEFGGISKESKETNGNGKEDHSAGKPSGTDEGIPADRIADGHESIASQDTIGKRRRRRRDGDTPGGGRKVQDAGSSSPFAGWERNWLEVAAELCGVDDGLPAELDGFELTKPQHRNHRLKALGNSIVPQVAMQVMRAIKAHEEISTVGQLSEIK